MSTSVLDSLVPAPATRKKNDAFALQGAEKPQRKPAAAADDSRDNKSFAEHVDDYHEDEELSDVKKRSKATPLPPAQAAPLKNAKHDAFNLDAAASLDTDAETVLPDAAPLPTATVTPPAFVAPETTVSADLNVDLEAAPPVELPTAPEETATLPETSPALDTAPEAPVIDTAAPVDAAETAPTEPVEAVPVATTAPQIPQEATAEPASTDLLAAAKAQPATPTETQPAPTTATAASATAAPAENAEPIDLSFAAPTDTAGDTAEIAEAVEAALAKQATAPEKQSKAAPILVPDPTASGAGGKEVSGAPKPTTTASTNPASIGAVNAQASEGTTADAGSNGSSNQDPGSAPSRFVQMLENKTATAEKAVAGAEPDSFAAQVNDASASKTADALKQADAPDAPQQQQALQTQNTNTANRTYAQPVLNQVPAAIVQLGVEIAARHRKNSTQFDIRLDPAELGGVDVRIEIDRHGRLKSHLFVEKAETLELLKADLRGLERALEQAGLRTDNGSLSLNLRDPSSQNPFKDSDGQSFHHGSNDNSQDAETVHVQVQYPSSSNATSGLDIRI